MNLSQVKKIIAEEVSAIMKEENNSFLLGNIRSPFFNVRSIEELSSLTKAYKLLHKTASDGEIPHEKIGNDLYPSKEFVKKVSSRTNASARAVEDFASSLIQLGPLEVPSPEEMEELGLRKLEEREEYEKSPATMTDIPYPETGPGKRWTGD